MNRKPDKSTCTVCGARPRAVGKTRCLECLAAERERARCRRDRAPIIAAKMAELEADAAACRDILAKMKGQRKSNGGATK